MSTSMRASKTNSTSCRSFKRSSFWASIHIWSVPQTAQGFVPNVGRGSNESKCSCEKPIDPRWADLLELKKRRKRRLSVKARRSKKWPSQRNVRANQRLAHRRAQHDKITAPGVSFCPNCGEPKESHRACLSCGEYRGRSAVTVVEYE